MHKNIYNESKYDAVALIIARANSECAKSVEFLIRKKEGANLSGENSKAETVLMKATV